VEPAINNLVGVKNIAGGLLVLENR